eukprot:scaffold147354_cov28-Prasinocladus_malaysianus.AAC.2
MMRSKFLPKFFEQLGLPRIIAVLSWHIPLMKDQILPQRAIGAYGRACARHRAFVRGTCSICARRGMYSDIGRSSGGLEVPSFYVRNVMTELTAWLRNERILAAFAEMFMS